MRILVRIAGALFGVIIIFVAVGFFLPAERSVSRSISIDAPPATVYALVNGFRHFNRFSPWAPRDPEAEYRYSGPAEGVGARMEWQSDSIGNGSQEITAVEPNRRVAADLGFDGEGGASAEFLIEAADDGSNVTWQFSVDFGYDLMGRYFGLMLDDFLGADYEEGLQRLKDVAEAYPKLDLEGFEPTLREQEATPLLRTRKRTAMNADAMVASMGSAFDALDTVLSLNEVEKDGRPRVITVTWDEAGGTWTFDAAYPLEQGTPITILAPGIDRETGYSGLVMEVVLEGADWQESTLAYEKAELYRELHGLEAAGNSWEEYESDPVETPPQELVTHIVFPVRRMPVQ